MRVSQHQKSPASKASQLQLQSPVRRRSTNDGASVVASAAKIANIYSDKTINAENIAFVLKSNGTLYAVGLGHLTSTVDPKKKIVLAANAVTEIVVGIKNIEYNEASKRLSVYDSSDNCSDMIYAATPKLPNPFELRVASSSADQLLHTFEVVGVKDDDAGNSWKLGLLWGDYDLNKMKWDQRKADSPEDEMLKDSAPRVSFGTDGVRKQMAMDRVVKIENIRSEGYLDFSVSGIINMINWTVFLSPMLFFFFKMFFGSKDHNVKIFNGMDLTGTGNLVALMEPVLKIADLSLISRVGHLLAEIWNEKSMLHTSVMLILLSAINIYDYLKRPSRDSVLRKRLMWANRIVLVIVIALQFHDAATSFYGAFSRFVFGQHIHLTFTEPYRLFTANFLHFDIVHILCNTLALLSWTTTIVEVGYGWRNFLTLYIGGGILCMLGVYLCEYTMFIPGTPAVLTIGASGAIYAVLVFGKLYLGRLLGGKEGADCTAMAMFMLLSEAALALLNPMGDGLLVFGIYTIALIGLLGDRKMSLPARFQLHSTYVVQTFSYLTTVKGNISHTGHAFGGLAGIFFFYILTPRVPGPFISSSEVTSALDNDIAAANVSQSAIAAVTDTEKEVSPRVKARASSVKKMLRQPSVAVGSVKKVLDQSNENALSPRITTKEEKDANKRPPLDRDSKYVFYQAIGLFVILIFVVIVVERANLQILFSTKKKLIELGLPIGPYTKDYLKSAFRKASLRLHPDKGGDAEQFRALREAYEALEAHVKGRV